jgi:amino-acid N-acetyltransferase
VLLGKERVELYEAVQEFLVAEDDTGKVIGCGALHVMWEDLGEVRTLAVAEDHQGTGIGRLLLERLLERAKAIGLSRIFCLTFEVDFFTKLGFEPISETPVEPEVYAELVRSHDEGIAEFLDLARVKQNTLGNTRMLKQL